MKSFPYEAAPVYICTDGILSRKEIASVQEQYIRMILLVAGQARLTVEMATLYLEPGDVAILRAEDNWRMTVLGDEKAQCIDLYFRIDFWAPAAREFMLKLAFRVLFQFELPSSQLMRLSQSLWKELAPDFDPIAGAQEKRFNQLHLDFSERSEAVRICREIESELLAQIPYYEVMLLSDLLKLGALLVRSYLSATKLDESSADFHAIQEIVQLLAEQYAKPWQLDELAALAHMSKSKLVAQFNEATGKTPIEYLIFVRLTRAIRLLRSTDKSITEIAFATGFSDSNYFSRLFRKYVGISPSDYRKQAEKN